MVTITTVQPEEIQDDEPYLLGDAGLEWQDVLDNVKIYLMSEVYVDEIKMRVPRFEYASFFARSLPFIAYDNSRFSGILEQNQLPNTAFTDGVNCFFNVEFLRKIFEADKAEGKEGLTFLALHEVWHNMLNHFIRLQDFPHHIANRAEDMYINTNLQKHYKAAAPSSVLSCGIGFKPGDIEKYSDMSEDDIARLMLDDPQYNPPPPPSNQMSAGGPPSSGSQGNSVPGSGSPGDFDENHLIDPRDLADALSQAGLGHAIGDLDIPTTAERVAERSKEIQQTLVATIQEANQVYREKGLALPGGHMNNYMMEVLNKLAAPKINWKAELRKLLLGGGMRFQHTDDYPSDALFYDFRQMGMAQPLYIGTRLPAKAKGVIAVFIDTSGSMGLRELHVSLSETFGLIRSGKRSTGMPEVMVFWADTVTRGEPILLTERNWRSVLREFEEGKRGALGRGGTHFVNSIKNGLESDELKKAISKHGELKSLIYFSDLGDHPPQRDELPDDLPKSVYFMACPGTYNDKFAAAVSDYAKTINMGERMTIDLDKSTGASMGSRRKMGGQNSSRGMRP